MSISLIDNLKIQNKKQNVERDSFATIADMVSYPPNYLPNIFHAMCEETGKMYVYNINNDEDPDLGKWRVLEGSGGGTADVPIEKIKVNGELQTPVNKVVDITVPSIEGLTKDVDLATVAKSGSYEDLINKPTIPSLDGYAKTTEIPSKVSQLENDSNYLSSIPEEYVTETELSAKGYLTQHQDISGKVDKVEGESLISDTEIARLATVDNYDDTDIKAEIAKKADVTSIPNKVSVLENDSKYQTESDITTTLTDYATKTYVGEQIANAEHLKREIVTVLPSDTEASDNIIYMLKVESATGNDKYQEYMKIDGTVQMVGDTSVDLTDYAKSAEIPTTVAELTDSTDYAKKTDLHSHTNKTVLDGITSTKVSNWDSAKTHADSAHAPSTAQANVIETVKVNGTALEVSDKAVNVTVPTTVAELTDSADYAKKTDIPTTLPANGGNSDTVNNHTVESDVPENAKFTDTVYDDTEVKGSIAELNRNLINQKGSTENVNPISDLNNFYTGIGLFNENTSNMPATIPGFWLILSGGGIGTTVQVAFNLGNFSIPKTRCCASNIWSDWTDIRLS